MRNVHPIAFHIGSLAVHWYGVMMALAVLRRTLDCQPAWSARRHRSGKTLDIGPWLIVGVIVGARAFYAIETWNNLMQNPFFPTRHGPKSS